MNKLIKILVVSNDPILFLLEKEGYQCSFVQDEYQALLTLDSNSFDVLILDWPNNGDGLLDIMSKLQEMRIILTSARFISSTTVPSFVDRIILRPYSFEDLLAIVKELT